VTPTHNERKSWQRVLPSHIRVIAVQSPDTSSARAHSTRVSPLTLKRFAFLTRVAEQASNRRRPRESGVSYLEAAMAQDEDKENGGQKENEDEIESEEIVSESDDDEKLQLASKNAPEESGISRRLQLHSEHSSLAREAIRSSSDEYDKNLLKLSTVFLGLSLSFMKDIVHPQYLTHVYSLYASWCLFALTVLAVVASFQISLRANLLHLSTLDDYYLSQDSSALNRSNAWNTAVAIVNLAAGAFFVLAIAFSVYFVIANFRRI